MERSRREFIKIAGTAAGVALAAVFINPKIALEPSSPAPESIPAPLPTPTLSPTPTPEPKPVFQQFDVALDKGHLLYGFPGITVRLPLNRAAFDKDLNRASLTPVQLDPFYKQGYRLTDSRKAGSRVILIMEMGPEDSESMLARMLEYAEGVIQFHAGDSIILGNELVRIKGHTPQVYASQATFLHRHIKSINQDIKIGLAGEAMHGQGELLESILPLVNFPVDTLPFHHYWLPQGIPDRFAIYRRMLDKYGFQKTSIAVGEAGVADSSYQNNPKGFLETTPETQPDTIIKALCFAKAAKCSSFSLYSAMDTYNGEYMERFGLVDDKHHGRPVFFRFNTIQELFNRPSFISGTFEEGRFTFILQGENTKTIISWDCHNLNTLGGLVTVT